MQDLSYIARLSSLEFDHILRGLSSDLLSRVHQIFDLQFRRILLKRVRMNIEKATHLFLVVVVVVSNFRVLKLHVLLYFF